MAIAMLDWKKIMSLKNAMTTVWQTATQRYRVAGR